VDAIHPGYGFCENADFAEKAEQNNIILLGLNQSHTYNGSKLAAKKQLKPIIFHGSWIRRSHY
jgi:acetyl/propionyl-CoA carboxylase alpha subunit